MSTKVSPKSKDIFMLFMIAQAGNQKFANDFEEDIKVRRL